jgi:hypothetical protein
MEAGLDKQSRSVKVELASLQKRFASRSTKATDTTRSRSPDSATAPPTSVLVTLAAAGRNPTDILIPTQAGTEGSGVDDDDDDVAGGGGSATSGGTFQAMDDPPPPTLGSNLVSAAEFGAGIYASLASAPAGSLVAQAAAAAAWSSAEDPLGDGDLVIIMAGSPAAQNAKNLEEEAKRAAGRVAGVQEGIKGSTYADFENEVKKATAAGKATFVLSKIQPGSLGGLAFAINMAVRENGGKKFKRIIILSHAGGPAQSPSIQTESKEKLEAESIPWSVTNAANNALDPTGIVVLGSCGYYYEDIVLTEVRTVDGKVVVVHDRVPRDPTNKDDQAYQEAWIARLGRLALAIGHAVFADAADSFPSARPGDAGSIRRNLDSHAPMPPKGTLSPGPIPVPNVPRIGVAPDGQRLP